MKIKLLSQPFGQSFGDELKDRLTLAAKGEYNQITIVSAFAKRAGVSRILPELENSKAEGHSKINTIVGFDHGGTSREAIELLYKVSDEMYVLHSTRPDVTFHPKIYIFENEKKSDVLIGSSNLTAGGLYTNIEASTAIEYLLPEDQEDFASVTNLIGDYMDINQPYVVKLDDKNVEALINSLPPEANSRIFGNGFAPEEGGEGEPEGPTIKGDALFGSGKFPKAPTVPGSAAKKPSGGEKEFSQPEAVGPDILPAGGEKAAEVAGEEFLVIQIKPHDNGEIFLSKTAVNQNKEFFGFPFTGETTPKKAANISYPQREPDPIVNISVYGAAGVELQIEKYNLNTVYYSTKSEIRITASPLVGVVPHYSILVMKAGDNGTGIDYVMDIYTPNSPEFAHWLGKCDQVMPSGGQVPRKFGWAK